MGSKCKRFLSVLLVAMLLLSMVPNYAKAEENTGTEATESEINEPDEIEVPGNEPDEIEVPGNEPDEIEVPGSEPEAPADPVCYQPGDANSDKEVHVNDAFYVLYNATFPDNYPINHSADYDGDGDVDADDALLVLKMAHGLVDTPEYTHVYYAPVWTWNVTEDETDVSVTFRCGCQENVYTFSASEGEVQVTSDGKAATCTESGSAAYTATVNYNGKTYTDTKTVTYEALGHTVGDLACGSGESATCDNCGAEITALDHNWVKTHEDAADCTTLHTDYYECSNCGAADSVTQENSYAHNWSETEVDVAVDAAACAYRKTYVCQDCGAYQDALQYDDEGNLATEIFYKHSYTAAITDPATCVKAGVKTFTCSCGDSYTEDIAVNPDAHVWDAGVESAGVITYTCSECGETKKAVNATDGAVSKESLADVSELKLAADGTSITLDDTTKALLEGENVSVSVASAGEEATANLTEAQKAQIGSNTVYNFTMTSDDTAISDFGGGTVTISLPYELQEGDDVDCIDVWYISDDGDVTVVKGTYYNGFVTFTTNHFSYYTVTRLQPEERCAAYGHSLQKFEKAATCTAEGYVMYVCQRCSAEVRQDDSQTIAMLAHNYETTRTEPTCTVNGMETKTCSACGNASVTTLFMLGHETAVTASQAATCTEAGYETIECGREGCAYARTTYENAAGHNYEYQETVDPTCTGVGYEIFACSNCGDTKHENERAALGHAWSVKGWDWQENYVSATVTLECATDSSHTITQKAVVTETNQGATCTASGVVTYTAKAAYNSVVYEDVQAATSSALGHSTADAKWEHTASAHYHTCDACEARYDQADHNWKRETTTAATCNTAGVDTLTCTVCEYSKTETTAATGAHSGMEDGTCDVCGFREETCDHLLVRKETIDVSAYNLCEGVELYDMVCDCGEYRETTMITRGCNWPDEAERREETVNGKTYIYLKNACTKCGLVSETNACSYVDEETCTYYDDWSEKYYLGDTVLMDQEHQFMMPDWHRYTKTVEEKTLTADGFCGADILIKQCGCGKSLSDESEYRCDWEVINDVEVCSVCGAKKWWDRDEPTVENCYMTWLQHDYLEYNGEILLTLEYDVGWMTHDFVLTSYEMAGESCEDGVRYYYECTGCDESWKEYSHLHYSDICETEDLSSWGNSCMERVVRRTCPCGQFKEYYTSGESNHDWNIISEDAETGTTVSACANCGYTLTSVAVPGEKNEDCEIVDLCTDTISNGGDRTITLERTDFRIEHNYSETRELLGETCEEGVAYRVICSDCGNVCESGMYRYHVTDTVESLDLADIGGCGGKYVVVTCLCGEYVDIEGWDEQCDWWYVESGDGYNIWKCGNCGITRKQSAKTIGVEGCVETRWITCTFSKDGKTLKTLSCTDIEPNHRYKWKLTLHEGAETCEDGFDARGECIDCGKVTERKDYYGCGWWTTDFIPVPEGTFCGDAYVAVDGCACGNIEGAELRWVDDGCNFDYSYDEETETERWICNECGVEWIQTEKWVKIEGSNCQYRVIQTNAYYKDGECVFSYEGSWKDDRHVRVWEQSLVDGATTCDGGYTRREYCQNCGEIFVEDETVYYLCETVRVARTVAATSAETCSDIYRDDYSCACGELTGTEYVTSCDLRWYGWDSENGTDEYHCRNCDLRYVHKASTTKVGCTNVTQNQATFYVGDAELYSAEYTGKSAAHIQIHEFILRGNTCDDGYSIRAYCAECGKTLWEDSDCYYGCDAYRTAYKEIGETACGLIRQWTYSCADGADSWTTMSYSCDFEFTRYDSKNNCDVYTCVNCGAERRDYETLELLDAEFCRYMVTYRQVYKYNGEELGTAVYSEAEIRHDYAYMFTLLGETCDDGYYARYECTQCGQINWEDDEINYGCDTYFTGEETRYFEDADICGPVTVRVYECACGKHRSEEIRYSGCDFQWVYDETTDTEIDMCVNCGLHSYSVGDETHDRDSCMYYSEDTHVFCVGDKEIGRITTNYQSIRHTVIVEFELLGTTCDDGYLFKEKCVYCGRTTYEETEVQYGCNTWAIAFTPIVNHPDVCGEIYMESNACACGENYFRSFNRPCDFEWISHDEDTGEDVYQCLNCGLVRRYSEESVTDEQNCKRSTWERETYLLNGEEVGSYAFERVEEYHTTKATFSLSEGASCEDGYYVTHECVNCDYTRTEEEPRYSHDTFTVETYALSDPNACGDVTFVTTACACGFIKSYESYHECSFEWTENQDADGYTIYECSRCGLGYSDLTINEKDDIENCTRSYTECFRFYRDGEQLWTLDIPRQYKNHNLIMTNAVLTDPEAGCLGGYTVTRQCPYCFETESDSAEAGEDTDHDAYCIDYVSVSEWGGCDSKLYFYSCACGENIYMGYSLNCNCETSYEEVVDPNGVQHSYVTETCQDCGLVIKEDDYWIPTEDPCYGTRYRTTTIQYKGETKKIFEEQDVEENHDYYAVSATLLEGALSCEDGVKVTYVCSRSGCEASYNTNYYGEHVAYPTETYDLTEYGSTCAGSLAHYRCACGKVDRYDLWNAECDLDWDEMSDEALEAYLPNAIIDAYQDTTEYTWTESNAWIIKCAVTDPEQCNLTVRMAEYWEANEATCTATEYQLWELGYDETTGESQLVIGPIATGESRGYHTNYIYSLIEGTDTDGNSIGGHRYDCPVCGSYYVSQVTYYGDGTYHDTHDIVNTLDNGETKERFEYWYYDRVANGYAFMTENRWGEVDGNGSMYWGQNVYTYEDPENPCYRTKIYSNIYGETDTSEEWGHMTYYVGGEWIKERTCSQYGYRNASNVCHVCGAEDQFIETYDPYEHDWYQNEEGLYICSRCGLENTNGSDGAITVEDMSDADNYIIGYYNRDSVTFSPYVSVVLYNAAEGQDDEPILSGIDISYLTEEDDGIRAISMSKAQVEGAVQEWISQNGYEGGYAVRIAFVPVTNESTLDYAITFDPAYTEGWAEPTESNPSEPAEA